MSSTTEKKDTPRAGTPPPKEKKAETKKEDTAAKTAESWTSPATLKKAAKWVAVLAVLFGVYKAVASQIDVKANLEKAVNFVEQQGNTAVYWYVAFTFIGVICLVPTTPMEVAGGFLFTSQYGLWVYVFTGCAKLCANVVSVLIARFVVKDWVMENVVKKSDLLGMVAHAVKDEPWKMAFLVRGSMVPLFVKNYGLGVTDIGYIPNACCSMIFTNFYAAQNIYMGSTMSDLKDVFAPKKASDGPQDWTATAKKLMPVFFNVLLIIFLVKAIKSQIKKQREAIEKQVKEGKDKKKD